MYAVIELGGKQYRDGRAEHLTVDRVRHDEGATFTPSVVFAKDGDNSILDPKALARVKVTAHVDEHLLGKTLCVFTDKPKHHSKKLKGHRSRLTRITIQDIAVGKRGSRAAAKEKAE